MVNRSLMSAVCIFDAATCLEASLASNDDGVIALQLITHTDQGCAVATLSPDDTAKLFALLRPAFASDEASIDAEPIALPAPSDIPPEQRPRLSLAEVAIGDHVFLVEPPTAGIFVVTQKIPSYFGDPASDQIVVRSLTNSEEVRWLNVSLFVRCFPSDLTMENTTNA